VQNAIRMSVCLNKLVMNVVSFPMYVNVAHLCVGVHVDCFCSPRFGWHGFCGCIRKELLCKILWMVSSSCWYSSVSKLFVFNLSYRNLTAVYLCCVV
jgi:hypothetical protein